MLASAAERAAVVGAIVGVPIAVILLWVAWDEFVRPMRWRRTAPFLGVIGAVLLVAGAGVYIAGGDAGPWLYPGVTITTLAAMAAMFG